MNDFETLQAKAIRSHFSLDQQCPKATLRLVTGVEPFDARIDLHVLLYYTKLCLSNPGHFLGIIHNYRSTNSKEIPVGFYFTVRRTLIKYGLEHPWGNITACPIKFKDYLKSRIWRYHWNVDVSDALDSNSLFASVFLLNHKPPTHPYKSHTFLNSLNSKTFLRNDLGTVLRFWLTPARFRMCTCGSETYDLAQHLLFSCAQTRKELFTYTSKLDTPLLPQFRPNTLLKFLRVVAHSHIMLEDFNQMIAKLTYPRY